MYYTLINNDSDMSFSDQIAIADVYFWLSTAKSQADSRNARTGDSWAVVKIETVYTAETAKEDEGPDYGKLWSDTSAELL